MSEMNRRIVLARRPKGKVTEEVFRLEEVPIEQPGEGQILVRNRYLSIDPYMRGRLDEARSYATPQALNEVMTGGCVATVLASNHPRFAVGDTVVGQFGWQHYAVSDGKAVRRVDPARIPLSAYLGVAGMPGVTAWVGLNRVIAAKAGETIVVSAASGAVGSVVGQLAKRLGCRVVGVAGGAAKCALVREEFGFDACVDYKGGHLDEALAAATPDGIDGYFENVGGAVLDAVLKRMNAFGRIAVCGLIAGYDTDPIPVHHFLAVLRHRLRIQGFIVGEFPDAWQPALAELVAGVESGAIRYRETVATGLDKAPSALLGLLRGENVGKQVIDLGAGD